MHYFNRESLPMKPNLTDPSALKPTDRDAHAVLDDDGNPWHPLDPEPPMAWKLLLRDKLDEATTFLKANSLVSMGVALGAGYIIGRVLAARAKS